MDSFHKNLAATSKKQSINQKHTTQRLQGLLQQLKSKREQVAQGSISMDECRSQLKQHLEENDILQATKSDHRAYHASISKLGKDIDRNFTVNLDELCPSFGELGGNALKELNTAIADHLVRRGKFSSAVSVETATGIRLNEELLSSFKEIYETAAKIRHGRLDEALQWAHEHSNLLEELGSSLEFRLHALRFVAILCGTGSEESMNSEDVDMEQSGSASTNQESTHAEENGNMEHVQRLSQPKRVSLALAYARQTFPYFNYSHAEDIGKLMAMVVYSKKIENSPYAEFADWKKITKHVSDIYVRDRCRVLGSAYESPLETVVNAGTIAKPVIGSLASKLQTTGMTLNQYETELPVEVPLPHKYRFHSVFCCPIQRGQVDHKNPPVLLHCGHVISAEALDGIITNRSTFKCPICPETMTVDDVRPLRIDPSWNENPNENESRISRFRFCGARGNDNGETGGNGGNRRRMAHRSRHTSNT